MVQGKETDIYTSKGRQQLCDSEGMTPEEYGFMEGFLQGAETLLYS